MENKITEADEKDESVKYLDIRNKAAYDETKAKLLEELSKMTVPKIAKPIEITKDNKHTSRGNTIGADGRTMTFGFANNRRGYNYLKTNKKYPELFKALVDFGNRVVPKGFEYQAITLNHNCKAKKHIDGLNVGASVIVGIGEYTGGALRVFKPDGSGGKDFQIHDHPAMFNGGILPHETQEFKGDKRYTLIFYKQKKRPRNTVGLGKGLVGAGGRPFEVAIPSYNRAELLKEKTLHFLKTHKCPMELITIFVANEKERKIYEETIPKDLYGKMVVGIKGLVKQRNFISRYYPKGTKIVNIDDDIRGFEEYAPGAHRDQKPVKNILDVIHKGFDACEKEGLRLWGVGAVPNGFYMSDKVSTDLRYCIGSFWGCINPGKEIVLSLKGLDDKEDYLRSILYYKKDGGVVRLNMYSPISSYYKQAGGMNDTRTPQTIDKAARYVVAKYPQYATLNETKKSGHTELKLKDNKLIGKGIGQPTIGETGAIFG